MTGQPEVPHETFEILLEKRIRRAESPGEAAELDKHLSTCRFCPEELETAQAERAMLNRETAALVEGFDWDSAEQAIRNRVVREKAIGSAPRLVGLLVSLALFWPICAMAGWLAYSSVALALVVTFGYWEWSSRTRPNRLLAKAMRSSEELIEAYEQHDRDARKERGAERFAILAGGALFVALAVEMAVTGDWLDVALAVLIIDFVWTLVRSAFSRANRARNERLDRGLISWRDYLTWSAPDDAGGMGSESTGATRAVWISRVRLWLCHALLVLLMLERGGTWFTVGAAVMLFHAYRIMSKSRYQRLLDQDDDDDSNGA